MKKLGMWAVVAFVGFLIGMSAESEVKPVSDVVVKNVEALASFVVNTDICMSFPGKDCVQLITTPSGSYYETYPDQLNKTN